MPGEDKWTILEAEWEGLPAVVAVDASLDDARRSKIRPWHLSIIMRCQDCGPKKLPSAAEVAVLDTEERDFEQRLCADGNARLLARVTWNGTRQFLYRVKDPELANDALQDKITKRAHARPFDYRMERDDAWVLGGRFLDSAMGRNPPGGKA
jgi:Family of unknown function (DUF695)